MTRTPLLLLAAALLVQAARPDRITRPVDSGHRRVLSGHVHPLARAGEDRGPVDPATPMDDVLILFQPSAPQQKELESLLAEQQDPSSPHVHRWLTPEEYGERFGLSAADRGKVVAWLESEGLKVQREGRGRNWVSVSGTAGRIASAFGTPVHRIRVDGESHFANVAEPSVPEAVAEVVGGFAGLNDFGWKSRPRLEPLLNTSGGFHFLAPQDYATIYNIAPLYQAGIDGSGQSIAIVGTSGILISDIRSFRGAFGLPANDPKLVLYGSTDPGILSAGSSQIEADLDLELAGAIAPNATLYYIYGPDIYSAMVAAVNLNLAPVISISFGTCEAYYPSPIYRAAFQQANAQGITIVAASGDSGAAGCDFHNGDPVATHGRSPVYPSILPEVTAVGGTEFADQGGNYWAASNLANMSSALSYIPETVWNETAAGSLSASGGGFSQLYGRPAWQDAPGVPPDNARFIPDISMPASLHTPAYVISQGQTHGVGGTSAAAPVMAAVIALLNQYLGSRGGQGSAALGNINPQLYRLARTAPGVFHDIVAGDNYVPCGQGSPDCTSGILGFAAAPGYDMATGIGSPDMNALFTNWTGATNPVTLSLEPGATSATLNDTLTVTARVKAANGGVPTGVVTFSSKAVDLGSATLQEGEGGAVATAVLPVYRLGAGIFSVVGQYAGDANFNSAGATFGIEMTVPKRAAVVSLSSLVASWAPAAPWMWSVPLTLTETAGVDATITGFLVDDQDLPLSTFPSTTIPANGTVNATVNLTGLSAPAVHVITVSGSDANGNRWSRQVSIVLAPPGPFRNFSFNVLTTALQNGNDPTCPWPVTMFLNERSGFLSIIGDLLVDGVSRAAEIPAVFGTSRLEAWGTLQGRLCFSDVTPADKHTITVTYPYTGIGGNQATVSFAGPATGTIAATPASVVLGGTEPPNAVISVNPSDAGQQWFAVVFPLNQTSSWLTLSQNSGTGPGQFQIQASSNGLGPGVYRAVVSILSATAEPQALDIPVMFLVGGTASGMRIAGVGNAFSGEPTGAPGMLLSIYGSKLANATVDGSQKVQYALGGVSATVNGAVAPVLYVSPSLVNIMAPYTAGAGPAVVGINNNGEVAGFHFKLAPSAPGVLSDGNGNLSPTRTAAAGGPATLYLTGAGEVTPAFESILAAPAGTTAAQSPALPLSVTVGGIPALIQKAVVMPGAGSTVRVDFVIPGSVPAGVQPVIVTVGGVASPAVTITLLAP